MVHLNVTSEANGFKCGSGRFQQVCFFSKLISATLFCIPLFAHAAHQEERRGLRYCEIILAKTRLNFTVFSTMSLNDCPEEAWNKLTVKSIKQKTGSFFVYLNGPRYWAIDGHENTSLLNKKQYSLDGINMLEVGSVHLKFSDIISGSSPYHEHQVNGPLTLIYKAEQPVYELINPKGNVFVMESYHIEKNALTLKRLSQLGTELKLPKGWRFRTGQLKTQMALKTHDNKTIVIQDNLLNTYQLATHDFLG